jgi:AcrR family transcriptional regulator
MSMPRHTMFSKEQIIDAAFELIREIGWKQVTARSIANHLGSSTMPIYSRMKSLFDLEKELKTRAHKMLRDYQYFAYTENPLLNLAVGYVAFAREEKQLFRFLYPAVRQLFC